MLFLMNEGRRREGRKGFLNGDRGERKWGSMMVRMEVKE